MSAAEVTNELAESLERAGIHPAHIYALRRCGFILTEMNQEMFSDEEIMEWEAALDTYFELHPDAEPL